MKTRIFLLTILLGLVTTIFSACCEDCGDALPCYCSDDGIIIGQDERDCACCGGWFIEIYGDTLRALTLPHDFYQTLEPGEIPLPVYLEWTFDEPLCLGDEILVECIRRQE